MNQSRCFCTKSFLLFSLSAILFSSKATVFIATDTISLKGKQVIVRASSELKSLKNDPVTNSLKNLYDNDSTTRWIEGSQLTGAGEWLDIKYPSKSKFRGMIFGLGCRKDFMCMEDYSIPLTIKVKIDDKPTFDYSIDWDTKDDARNSITRQEVNMRKAMFWFNTDTAFTTASIQVKFETVQNGQRYQKLAMSDLEPIDADNTQFDLLNILKNITINPNDMGTVNSPVIMLGQDSPARIKQCLDSVYSDQGSSWKNDSAKIDFGLNVGMHAITDPAELTALIGVLKQLFLRDNKLIRFRTVGRTMTYMMKIGPVSIGDNTWDIWRYISTTTSSKGIELSIKYVPFKN